MLCQGQPDGGESCIVLESRSPCSPVAKLLQLSYVVHELCAASDERCERGYRQLCVETLLPDVVAPDMHQNDCSYVCELSGPTFDYLCKN